MFYANFWVGLIALIIVPVYFWVTWLQAKKMGNWRREFRDSREKKNQGILSIINAISVIKSFNREHIEANKQLQLQKQITENQMITRRVAYVFERTKTLIEQIGLVLIIILTSFFVIKGQMSIGMIMYHVLLFNNVSAPIRSLHRIYDEMNDALIYSESFYQILEADDEIEHSGSLKPNLTGYFELKNVDFGYSDKQQVLQHISMTIKPNQVTALVGLSGAGKSTLISLLDKFYIANNGTITLDGTDINDIDTTLSSLFKQMHQPWLLWRIATSVCSHDDGAQLWNFKYMADNIFFDSRKKCEHYNVGIHYIMWRHRFGIIGL